MKIALVGYGKMGHLIEETALSYGHTVVTTVDIVAPDAKVHGCSGNLPSCRPH